MLQGVETAAAWRRATCTRNPFPALCCARDPAPPRRPRRPRARRRRGTRRCARSSARGRVELDRRLVLPAGRQRRDRRGAVHDPQPLRLRPAQALRHHRRPAAGDAGPVVVPPRLPAAGAAGPGRRAHRHVQQAEPARAAHQPPAGARRGLGRGRRRHLRRSAGRLLLPGGVQLAARGRRGRGRQRAAHGAVVVPGQRPPARPRRRRPADAGPAGQAGGQQRTVEGSRPGRDHDRVALARHRADGALPRLLRRRPLPDREIRHPDRALVDRRVPPASGVRTGPRAARPATQRRSRSASPS